MASTNKTANFNLPQWQSGDKPTMQDFNSAFKNLSDSAVPTARKVNGKALSADISLAAADVGAASTSDLSGVTNEGNFSGNSGWWQDKKTGLTIQWGKVNIALGAGTAINTVLVTPTRPSSKILSMQGNCSYNITSGNFDDIESINISVGAYSGTQLGVKAKSVNSALPARTYECTWLVINI